MPAVNIESAQTAGYHSILSSPGAPGGHARMRPGAPRGTHNSDRPRSPCMAFMRRLINCFRSSDHQEQPSRPRPIVTDLGHQYQAPIVTPSPRASGGSVSSCEDEHDFERGTLLPKRRTPEPGAAASSAAAAAAAASAATTAAAAAAASQAADTAGPDASRHRRTGSDGARLHVEGVRARVLTSAAAAAAAKAKFGTSEAEFNAVAELLGTDAEDEDFCPTCLEAYTDDNPKIFTRCGHAFHMQCIYAWLERKNTCPLCESAMDLQDDILL